MSIDEKTVVSPTNGLLLIAMFLALADSEPIEVSSHGPHETQSAMLRDKLRELSLADIERLAKNAALELALRFDSDQLFWSLHTSNRKREERTLLEYFVRNGAPRTLIHRLFRTSKHQIQALRGSLQLPPPKGRPSLPCERVRDAITAAWSRLVTASDDERVAYYELHQLFQDFSLATLDAVVREFQSFADQSKGRPARSR
jgi:Protein of unknown function (DUF2857)